MLYCVNLLWCIQPEHVHAASAIDFAAAIRTLHCFVANKFLIVGTFQINFKFAHLHNDRSYKFTFCTIFLKLQISPVDNAMYNTQTMRLW